MINFSAMRYLHRVRCCLPCPFKMKKKIMEPVKHNVENYLLENQFVNYQNLVDRFGEPQQIACAFIDAEGAQQIVRNMHIRKGVICIVAATALAIVVIWAGAVGAAIAGFFDSTHGITYVYVD